MTDKEAARLYHLGDIRVSLWGYWGIERPGQPRLADRLAKEVLQFSTDTGHVSLLCREVGKGCVMLSLPSLKVAGSNIVHITESDEGPILVAVEGDDEETWTYGVWLYRLVRRIYPSKGKGGKPGQISWKIVATWLREEPELLKQFVELLVERKLRRWEQEQKGVAIRDSDRKWARQDAFLEIKRGLARAGLKLAELRKNS
ncbi:MAG: hypothetical protein HYU85_01280 [Chloroflexi bacterium]|nr:hypothetical protein [Chloroflexota bacterium]